MVFWPWPLAASHLLVNLIRDKKACPTSTACVR